MINTTDRLMFLKDGLSLSNDIRDAISETISLMRTRLNTALSPDQIHGGRNFNLAFIKYFSNLPDDTIFTAATVESWYAFALSNSNYLTESEFNMAVGILHSPDKPQWVQRLTQGLKGAFKIALLFLYCKKSLLLTYHFPRVRLDWLEDDNLLVPCYTECMRFLRSFDKHRKTNSTKFLHTAKPSTLKALYGQGMKMLVASTWYTPEDIQLGDLLNWRFAQSSSTSAQYLTMSPLPLRNFITVFREQYVDRFSITIDAWLSSTSPGTPLTTETAKQIPSLIQDSHNAFDTAKSIVESSMFSHSSFSVDRIAQYDLTNAFSCLGYDIEHAYDTWTNAQRLWLSDASYQNDRGARIALGRLNIYLFIYLPLWFCQNPTRPLALYPSTPNMFKSGVHFTRQCHAPRDGRPLTYMEFHEACQIPATWQGIVAIRRFFEYLIHFSDSIPGCSGIKQPVHQGDIPLSKRYSSVQKNVFSKRLLALFLRYLYSLESLQDNILNNSSEVLPVLCRAIRRNSITTTLIDPADLGYVPIAYYNGQYYKISYIQTTTLPVLSFNGSDIYYPGLLRHIIGMLETGLRGQAIQWLDAETYDKGVDRSLMDAMDFNSLWVNTDKARSTGFFSLVSNRVINLFDKQKAWRNELTQRGAIGLDSEIPYEGNPKSRWGRIKPLFSMDFISGAPFSDTAYKRYWASLCYSFQLWLDQHELDHTRLVALIPLTTDNRKSFIKWEDWENGLHQDDVCVLTGNEAALRWRIHPDTLGGDVCPVTLRSYITPHGARASFVSSLITVLPADYRRHLSHGPKSANSALLRET